LFKFTQRKDQLDWKQIANVKIFSNGELLVFVAIFALLAFVLFPKGRLEEIIVNSKEYNYELSRIYLERLLKIEFKPELLFSLVEKEMRLGNYEKALNFLESYKEKLLSRKKTKEEFLRYKYAILKAEFFSSKSPTEKEKLKGEMKRILLALTNLGGREILEEVFRESLSMDFPDVALEASERLALLTGELRWRQEAFRLSLSLSMPAKALQHLIILMKEDKKRKESYLKTAMLLAEYLRKKELYEELVQDLLNSGKFSLKDLQDVVNFELYYKDCPKALSYCLSALRKKNKEEIFNLCLNLSLWCKEYTITRRLIEENMTYYLCNPQRVIYLLKVALSLNDQTLAEKLAKIVYNLYFKSPSALKNSGEHQ
jgi:hypothetical protein